MLYILYTEILKSQQVYKNCNFFLKALRMVPTFLNSSFSMCSCNGGTLRQNFHRGHFQRPFLPFKKLFRQDE